MCCKWQLFYDDGCVSTYYIICSSWSCLFNKLIQCLLYFSYFLSFFRSFVFSFFTFFFTLLLSVFIFLFWCIRFTSQNVLSPFLENVFFSSSFYSLSCSLSLSLFLSILLPLSLTLFLSFSCWSFLCSDCTDALSFASSNLHASVHSGFYHFTPINLV